MGMCMQVDDDDVEVLVDLMRIPAAMAKQLLQRVFSNLTSHHLTRRTALRLIMRLLFVAMVHPDPSRPDGAVPPPPPPLGGDFLLTAELVMLILQHPVKA